MERRPSSTAAQQHLEEVLTVDTGVEHLEGSLTRPPRLQARLHELGRHVDKLLLVQLAPALT